MAKLLLKHKCHICKKRWVLVKPYICDQCKKRFKEDK